VKTPAYPVETMGGMVWAYLGPADKKPLLPRIDGFVTDGTIRMLGRTLIPVNWLQIMENSLDPIHTEWLHGHTYEFVKQQQGQATKVAISARHEKIAFREFAHGITKHRLLAGHSEDSDDWRIGHPVVFPNILSVGNGDEASRYYAFQIRVPADDTHTLHLWYTAYVPPKGVEVRKELFDKVYVYDVPYRDKDGEFIVDNIDGQDMMAWITQGPIADRTLENLGASDNGIALYRRVLRHLPRSGAERAHPPAERTQEASQQRRRAKLDHAHARGLFADCRGRHPDVRGLQASARTAAGGGLINDAMSDAANSDRLRILAEQAGLNRALRLFPDGVKAAAERGLRPLGDHAKGHVPTAHPAPVFDPTQFERDK
jgi:hypothetical protein